MQCQDKCRPAGEHQNKQLADSITMQLGFYLAVTSFQSKCKIIQSNSCKRERQDTGGCTQSFNKRRRGGQGSPPLTAGEAPSSKTPLPALMVFRTTECRKLSITFYQWKLLWRIQPAALFFFFFFFFFVRLINKSMKSPYWQLSAHSFYCLPLRAGSFFHFLCLF